ncbi:amidohydrolase [Amycolatopsis jejuensis]|uniref:amidohydrolase n=1 Tax=Amycolatopsis jejuensis TaxID=330084 RepID=UPI0005272842|nr:amidohydrolase [Amycolatopsis jejuensis]
METQQADTIVAADAVVAPGDVLPDHAVAIRDGRILALGRLDEMHALRGPKTDVQRLGGLLVPGFFDSHNHLLMTGMAMLQPSLAECRSIAEILDVVRSAAGTGAPGEWIVTSAAWHESALAEQRMPTAEELDTVSLGRPVFMRRGGHNVVLNTRALEVLEVERTSGEEPGTTVVRGAGDRPTGHVVGTAYVARLAARLPAVPELRKRQALAATGEAYARAGITSVIEPGLQPGDIELIRRLGNEGALPLRVRMMWRVAQSNRDIGEAVRAVRYGIGPQPYREDWTSLFGLKVGVDGGVETGCYRDPYEHPDDPEHPHGKALIGGEELRELCEAAAPTGWHVGVHCVGDAAIDEVLTAFEAAHRTHSIADRRWTLIHMMYPRPDHWSRVRALGLTVTAQQPLHYALAAGFQHYLGAERAHDIEPLRQYLTEVSLPVGGGSDSPVAPFSPLLGIQSSVTRSTRSAGVVGPEWAITVAEALRMYTSSSAWCAFEEDHVGTLSAGRAADLTCLSHNVVRDPDALPDTEVTWTMAGGRVTYAGS